MFEAALYGVPSIVAVSNPNSDTIIHEVTKRIVIRPFSSHDLAEAIKKLYFNRSLLDQLSENAKGFCTKILIFIEVQVPLLIYIVNF